MVILEGNITLNTFAGATLYLEKGKELVIPFEDRGFI